MAQPFLTPTKVLYLAPLGAIPRAEIPGPQGCGTIGAVTHSGMSTGMIQVGGCPVDVEQVILRVKTGGDLGVAELEISTDNGMNFGDALLMEANAYAQDPLLSRWTNEIGGTGIVIVATNGVGTPNSFIAGDTWTFTTTASPLILQHIASAEAIWLKWAMNTGQKIDFIDAGDQQFIAEIVRVKLVAGRGKVEPDWWTLYHEAMKHFKCESTGDIRLNSTPDPDAFVFPDRERTRPPFSSYWRH